MQHISLFAGPLFLLIPLVSARLTEQRCYYGPEQLADPEIIPCFPGTRDEVLHCCKRGSHCLDEASCWDPETGVTYQYGCTDPKYEGDNCPAKCGLDTGKFEVERWQTRPGEGTRLMGMCREEQLGRYGVLSLSGRLGK